MVVIVGSTTGRMAFRSDVGTGSSSHVLVGSLLIINLISSLVTALKEFNFGMLDGVGLYSGLLSNSYLIFLTFPMKKSVNSFVKVSSSSCLGSGLFDVVPVKCLTSEYNFLCCFHIQLSHSLMFLVWWC